MTARRRTVPAVFFTALHTSHFSLLTSPLGALARNSSLRCRLGPGILSLSQRRKGRKGRSRDRLSTQGPSLCFQFKNQQSSLDNHQSNTKIANSVSLRTNGSSCAALGLNANSQTALRAVAPLTPPPLSPPAKAPVEKGGQAVMSRSLLANISVYSLLVVEDFREQRMA